MTVGHHHHCTIDWHSTLRCTGHNVDGRSSLYWPDQVNAPPLTTEATEAVEAAFVQSLQLGEGVDTELSRARKQRALLDNPPPKTHDACTGSKHTCAIVDVWDRASGNYSGTALRCWGANYSALNPDAVNELMRNEFAIGRGTARRVVCGARFACAMQHVQGPKIRFDDPDPGWYPYCTGRANDRQGGEEQVLPSPLWPTGADGSLGRFDQFEAGANHVCGVRSYQLVCFGDYAPLPLSLGVGISVFAVAIGYEHTCVEVANDRYVCFSGTGSAGPRDAAWLEELLSQPAAAIAGVAGTNGDGSGGGTDEGDGNGAGGGKWSEIASISLGDSIACVVGKDGQAYCGGEPGMYELRLLRPPVKLQPARIDLVERGISFSSIACGGYAARNSSLVQLGEQFVCGLTHAQLVHCWGRLPPHHGTRMPREDISLDGTQSVAVPFGFFAPLDEPNQTVVHVRNRRRVERSRYLRDFGLKVLLDTQPHMSAAEVVANFSSPYLCYNVPRRHTRNISDWLSVWLGGNISNASDPVASVRSWHITMLFTLQLAAYTDGLSCFNFTQPFPELHCAPMVRFVNRTVAVELAPPKPFTVETMSSTDMYTTKFSLAHTRQPDGYCYEKLRLTPSEQFKRGAAWHRATQRVIDGFELLLTFQIDNAARLCKTVRALVTGTLLYERCAHTGSDGLALLFRGGGPPTALGGGGASIGYGGLNRTLAIEFDTWHNSEMSEMHYDHVSVQTGGPSTPVGAHREQYLSAVSLDPASYPQGLADGKAHLVRIRYTPGFDATLLRHGPTASTNNLKCVSPVAVKPIPASTLMSSPIPMPIPDTGLSAGLCHPRPFLTQRRLAHGLAQMLACSSFTWTT